MQQEGPLRVPKMVARGLLESGVVTVRSQEHQAALTHQLFGAVVRGVRWEYDVTTVDGEGLELDTCALAQRIDRDEI
jgi:hypothetical protein